MPFVQMGINVVLYLEKMTMEFLVGDVSPARTRRKEIAVKMTSLLDVEKAMIVRHRVDHV